MIFSHGRRSHSWFGRQVVSVVMARIRPVLDTERQRVFAICFAAQSQMLHSDVTRVSMSVQELRGQTTRVRMMVEKALQQVEQALQGGQHQQRRGSAGSAKGAPPAPQRSQADADLAMQMLLVTCRSQLR
jgi:hypothetical protein